MQFVFKKGFRRFCSIHDKFVHMGLYVIYTNRGGGLYQIYKPEAKPRVYTTDITNSAVCMLLLK